ncbi:Hypothetical predicted protein [Marmota monax]|uniref:Uncharacterized protein n=1 Tax=Marmota monax TaxID=9995 RepID=A0A5E4CWN0_MARMO|nr:hypothetical protein GHT09_005209 [Marmota monax]VTJ85352.1 Hypothetical predicted protein [Marmota monax]
MDTRPSGQDGGAGTAEEALFLAVLLALLAPWTGRGGPTATTSMNSTLEAELEHRWESLLAASQHLEAAIQSSSGDYIKQLQRLYYNVGIGCHLQVLPDCPIGVVHADTSDSVLELSPVEQGILSIFRVASRFFLNGKDHYFITILRIAHI